MSTASLQTSEKVSALREQRRKMTARINTKIAQAQAKRKQDLQLKIVVGAAAMKLAEQGKISWADLSDAMSEKDRMRLHIPNAETRAAIEDSIAGKNLSPPMTLEAAKAELTRLAAEAAK